MNSRKNCLHYIQGSLYQLLSYKLILIIIAIAFCICLDTWNQIPFLWNSVSTMPIYYYIFNSFSYGGTYVPYVVPMLAASVYALSYCKEMSSGMDMLIIGRIGSVKKYAFVKVLITSLSGGFVYFLGFGLFTFIASRFQPFYDTCLNQEVMGLPYFSCLNSYGGLKYLIIILYLVFLNGILWSSLALLCSAFLKNTYATIASPLLISYFLRRICIILKVPSNWRIDYWLTARTTIGNGKLTLLMCTFSVLAIIVISYFIFMRKIKFQMNGGNKYA